jgi:hypothetical protein
LKLVWGPENWTSNENQDSFVFKHCIFCFCLCKFSFFCGICKLLCWYLIYSYKLASKIIFFLKTWQFKATFVLRYNCQPSM